MMLGILFILAFFTQSMRGAAAQPSCRCANGAKGANSAWCYTHACPCADSARHSIVTIKYLSWSAGVTRCI